MRRLALALGLLLCLGCASQPQVKVTCLSEGLSNGAKRWGDYVQRHVPGAHVVVVHGIDHWGMWWVSPDSGPAIPTELFVKVLHACEPRRPIVLVCCNSGGYTLNTPNVWYGKKIMVVPPMRHPKWIGGLERMTYNPKGEYDSYQR